MEKAQLLLGTDDKLVIRFFEDGQAPYNSEEINLLLEEWGNNNKGKWIKLTMEVAGD